MMLDRGSGVMAASGAVSGLGFACRRLGWGVRGDREGLGDDRPEVEVCGGAGATVEAGARDRDDRNRDRDHGHDRSRGCQ
jgi:hypothetical protein